MHPIPRQDWATVMMVLVQNSISKPGIGDGIHTITAAATDDNGTDSDAMTIKAGTSPAPSFVIIKPISYR